MNDIIDVLASIATDNKGALDRHKVAKLILQDCISQIASTAHTLSDPIPGYEPVCSDLLDGTINGLREAVDIINNHFGVNQ